MTLISLPFYYTNSITYAIISDLIFFMIENPIFKSFNFFNKLFCISIFNMINIKNHPMKI